MTTADATSRSASSLRKDRSGRPFHRVLIANRGEIAVRIIRACRALGVETVAVYSDADVHARHVLMADVAVRLGGAAPAESYLRADLIVEAGLAHHVEAIHPGYGFLSERASFARAVIAAGIAFIGPDPAAIDALGDKMAARRTAQAADVPVVPGTFEPARVDRPDFIDLVMRDAERIGFPLLVKASAGGGGRGMRRVASAAELPAALAAGAAEAESAFGDGSVYLEREIRPARHIEVQLIGDQSGSIVALGERDCSIQRRHQKLIEESPAPDLTSNERATLHAMAVRAATAACLHNAATAEFLFDAERRFWFLEVNARLQVEHGVTELVSGIDLVREQLWIAAGAPLSPEVHAAATSALAPTRHAIEIRLSAEDPARDFAPTPGRIGAWVMPSGPGIRVDSAVEAGERIPPDYDPMIAKIMSVGADREAAISTMVAGLKEVVVTGVQTTLPFHHAVMAHPSFRAAELSTDWVIDHWDGPAARHQLIAQARAAAAGAITRASADAPSAPAGTTSLHKDDPGAGTSWRDAARRAAVDRWPR